MGLLLREALRRLCVEGGWSYAVFWRAVECGNSRHLVWGEGHHEPSRVPSFSGIPVFKTTDSLLEEWGVVQKTCNGGTDAVGCQSEDGLGALVEKMMRPQLHLVGYGMIGSAAFTGNHQWMLLNELNGEGYNSEGLAEINNQLIAGIQTLVIIPVLPHGVVQVGSNQMIMENMGFVNHVRSVFTQLECVPVALPPNNALRPSYHKAQSPSLSELHMSEYRPGNNCKIVGGMSFAGDSCNNQNFNIPDSRPVTLLSRSSVSGIYDSKPPASMEVPLSSKEVLPMVTASLNEFLLSKAHAMAKPVGSLTGKQNGQSADAQELSNSEVMLNLEAVLHGSNSDSQCQPSLVSSSGLTSSSLTFLEQQLFASYCSQEHTNNRPTSDDSKMSQQKPLGSTVLTCFRDSTTVSSLGRCELSKNVNALDSGRFGSHPDSIWAKDIVSDNTNLSQKADLRSLNNKNSPNINYLPSGEVTENSIPIIGKDVLTASTSEKQKVKNDVFQALGNPSTSLNRCIAGTSIACKPHQPCLPKRPNHAQGSQKSEIDDSDQKSSLTLDKGKNTGSDSRYNPVHIMTEKISGIPSMPSGCDLFDAWGLDLLPRQSTGSLDALFASMACANAWVSNSDVSTCISEKDADPIFDATRYGISCNEILSDTGHDQLLDAVVSKVKSGAAIQSSDDIMSCKTTLTNISHSVHNDGSNKHGQLASSGKRQQDVRGPLVSESETAGSVSVRSSCSMDKMGYCSPRDAIYKSQISLWVENNQNMKNDSTSSSHCKRVDETSKSNRKRPKPGESPRPRPKDRQMIQDRVKELREIVPSGAKCSIDALFERTIKHMLFLQSVTKHADKLKETGEPKIISKEGGLLLKDNFEGGATWAFEVGSQSMICPIIVEDLNPPRQLLVEMLCENRGFFLEIADLIKGLGLTILKGVMEACGDKVWARFAVEANRDVTRMDIFLSLVRLLEPTAVNSVAPQSLDNNLAHNMFCQSSIPATGMTNHLQ